MPDPRRRHALAALLAALGGAASEPAFAQRAFDMGELMRLLGEVKSGRATFVERRTVSMLDRTLESSGQLAFEAPDSFVRETLKPRHERVAVFGNTLTMSLGTRSRSMPVDAVPEAGVVVEAIRGTLTGNREALERNFVATVEGQPQRWTLDLKPREPRLRELVISVRLAGESAQVRQVAVAMADGDRSVMTVDPMPAAPTAAASRPAS